MEAYATFKLDLKREDIPDLSDFPVSANEFETKVATPADLLRAVQHFSIQMIFNTFPQWILN